MTRKCPTCQTSTDAEVCPADGAATVAVGIGASAALLGTTIGQRYEVLALIGEGGFGAVYRARHTGTGDIIAVKLLRTEQAGNAETVARFRDEAAVTASLKQPHTVRVFDFGQTDGGDLYLAMEFLDGRTLSRVLRDDGPLPYQRVGAIALQVLKSLAEAHARGLVHRDLKPDNIFLQNVFGEDDFVKVLDFGIAKSLAQGSTSRTAAGVIVGTPPYMSPEQARGAGVDARTDLYALGCILYEATTGLLPFASESAIDTLIQRITLPPPRAHDKCLLPTPPAFCEVIRAAMTTAPEDRFASAADFATALSAAMKAPVAQVTVTSGEGADADAATVAGDISVVRPAVVVPRDGRPQPSTAVVPRPGPATERSDGPAAPVAPAAGADGAGAKARPRARWIAVAAAVIAAGAGVAFVAGRDPPPAAAAAASAAAPEPEPAPAPATGPASAPAPGAAVDEAAGATGPAAAPPSAPPSASPEPADPTARQGSDAPDAGPAASADVVAPAAPAAAAARPTPDAGRPRPAPRPPRPRPARPEVLVE